MHRSTIYEKVDTSQRYLSNATPAVPAHAIFRSGFDVLQQVGVAISRVAMLAIAVTADSRDGLASKESQLAGYGVTWATDLAHDTELARELEVARKRRQTVVPPALPARPGSPLLPRATTLGWAIGALLIRTGRRLQGGQPI